VKKHGGRRHDHGKGVDDAPPRPKGDPQKAFWANIRASKAKNARSKGPRTRR